MGSILLVCVLLIIALSLGYKIGKRSKEWEVSMLQNDNTKLAGEVHMLEREIDRFIENNFIKNNTKELEEIPWD